MRKKIVEELSSTDAETPLPPRAAALLTEIEKYVLPLVYAFLAWQRVRYIDSQVLAYGALAGAREMPAFSRGLFFAEMAKQGLLFALMTFSGVALLLNRPPASLPGKLKHVLVPLAVSYYFVLYGAVDYGPPWMHASLIPPASRFGFAILGLISSVIGYSIAIWALVYLRRSFALFVSVRDVVTDGPYHYVRHPIYLGYLFDVAGLLLVTDSIGMVLLAAGFVVLLICRARMEEEMLGDADAGYRRYILETGFLLPRLRTGGRAE